MEGQEVLIIKGTDGQDRTYEIIEELGQGASCTVYRARYNGRDYTVKVAQGEKHTLEEVRLSHGLITSIMEAYRQRNINYVMNDLYIGQGERDGQSVQVFPAIYEDITVEDSLEDVLKEFLSFLDGLSILHEIGYLHNDIKADNIYRFRLDNQSRVLQIIDFNSATQVASTTPFTMKRCTRFWYTEFDIADANKLLEKGNTSALYVLDTTAAARFLVYMLSKLKGHGGNISATYSTVFMQSLRCNVGITGIQENKLTALLEGMDPPATQTLMRFFQKAFAWKLEDRYLCAKDMATDIQTVLDILKRTMNAPCNINPVLQGHTVTCTCTAPDINTDILPHIRYGETEYTSLEALLENTSGNCLITGEGGRGKTSTLLHYTHEVTHTEAGHTVCLFVPLRTFLSSGCNGLIPFISSQYTDCSLDEDKLKALLENPDRTDRKTVILLDAYDEIKQRNDDGRRKLFQEIKSLSGHGVRFVMTSRYEPRLRKESDSEDRMDSEEDLSKDMIKAEFQPLREDQLQTYLTNIPGLFEKIEEDHPLHELLQNAMMLTLFQQTYEGITSEEDRERLLEIRDPEALITNYFLTMYQAKQTAAGNESPDLKTFEEDMACLVNAVCREEPLDQRVYRSLGDMLRALGGILTATPNGDGYMVECKHELLREYFEGRAIAGTLKELCEKCEKGEIRAKELASGILRATEKKSYDSLLYAGLSFGLRKEDKDKPSKNVEAKRMLEAACRKLVGSNRTESLLHGISSRIYGILKKVYADLVDSIEWYLGQLTGRNRRELAALVIFKIVSLVYQSTEYEFDFGNIKNIKECRFYFDHIKGCIYDFGSYEESPFADCKILTSIRISGSVRSITEKVMEGCTGLTSIAVEKGNSFYHTSGNCLIETASKTLVAGCKNSIIPQDGSVESIGFRAFQGCSGLTSITIPRSVTYIGFSAFAGCTGLTSITIPCSVKSIGMAAFRECSGLTSIIVEKENAFYYASGNCLIEMASRTLIAGCMNSIVPQGGKVVRIYRTAFQRCSGLTSITIPDGVTCIEFSSFSGCSSLENITIPNSVTHIGEYAFLGCSSLENITIPNSVTHIGKCAFYNCSSLAAITIPNSVTSIGESALSGCSSLVSITIPNSVTHIGESAFWGCSSLVSITIPNSVTHIGESAFWGCSSLAAITIPDSVTSIGKSALSGCSSLVAITIPDSVKSIGKDAFWCCSSLENITIPNSVTHIGESAFWGCSSLATITIPDSVTIIEDSAFLGCDNLKSIVLPSSVKSIGANTLLLCDSLTSIYYNGTKAQWQALQFDPFPSNPTIFCDDGTI